MKPETHLRLGVGEVLLGRYQSGLEHLKKAGDLGMACYFRGLAQENQQQYEAAARRLRRRPSMDTTRRIPSCTVPGRSPRGQEDEARKILAGMAKQGDSSAEFHFQQGCLLRRGGR